MPRSNRDTKRSTSISATKTKSGAKPLPAPTPSEAAFERAFDALLHPERPEGPGERSVPPRQDRSESARSWIERAFEKADEYLQDRYATIGDAASFYTKLAGVTFEGRQDTIHGLHAGAELRVVRDPGNPHDPNAVAIYYGHLQIGFLNREMAAHLAPLIDAGARYRASVASLTGGGERSRGVNVLVERDAVAAIAQREQEHAAVRAATELVRNAEELRERIGAALIGSAQPHDAQLAVLERVESGKNTLAVLGTGRGKSYCFQFTAAIRAFTEGAKTLVVYPLRALVNDQYEAMARKLDPLGLRIYRANGSIGGEERRELFEALREGAWDVVLATPEFLEFHREAFTGASRPSLVVIDEAHHVHESRHRPSYARLAQTLAGLENPQVLALTATAADDAFTRICGELRIEAWVIDPTVRDNLCVVDARGRKDKLGYLIQLFSAPEKGIVYCNARGKSVEVARSLRARIGDEVMFYHAKMPTADRHQVERSFRDGALRVVVATSAFGEGIDLPDVRHVVLYHLNFDFAEFNQQAGRAGRDGSPAQIHLLYGERDRRLNEYLIDCDAPRLPVLREIYRGLKAIAREGGIVRSSYADMASALHLDGVRDRTIGSALQIFADAGLVEIGADDEGRFVRLLPVRGKIDLEANERYAEGEATRESFARFCALALEAPAPTLERIVNRPIYPGRVALRR